MILHLFLVPSSPPMNLTVYSTSSTSLSVSWNPVPTEFENGIITGYRVFYMDQAESKPKLKHTVSSTTFSVDLTDLSVYTNYCIQVLAFTQAGDGVPSDCVVASTDEGGNEIIIIV